MINFLNFYVKRKILKEISTEENLSIMNGGECGTNAGSHRFRQNEGAALEGGH
jgi:hypothetical protein